MARVTRFAAALLFTGALAVVSPATASAESTSEDGTPDPGVNCILCWPNWDGVSAS